MSLAYMLNDWLSAAIMSASTRCTSNEITVGWNYNTQDYKHI